MPHSSAEIEQAVAHMASLPDVRLDSRESKSIHDALLLIKCVKCHDESQLYRMGSMTIDQMKGVIFRMAEKPGADISLADSSDILRTLQSLQGF